ncbi:hypothetical protein HPB51_016637 [Rhipicephalus microplus]|uniref:Transposable element P transposase-like RNase H C-terminal domain-containing protein n=1 Tax=Rhipicephalus microplus TaxID=6941 RepID=A0A9J6EHF5_RHIMP|nr:hypothetical protein HPB51_016637 [Rhipicephalus microplus]
MLGSLLEVSSPRDTSQNAAGMDLAPSSSPNAQALVMPSQDHSQHVAKSDSRIIFYIAGYVARKCILKSNCKDCSILLTTPVPDESFQLARLTLFRDNGGLLYPSACLFWFIKKLEDLLTGCFSCEQLHADSILDVLTIVKARLWQEVIKDFLVMLDTTEFNQNAKNTLLFASRQTTESLRVTLLSIIDIIDELHKAGVPYVLTAKLNQDLLERFFGIVRSFHGDDDHPTIIQFSQIYRLLSLFTPVRNAVKGSCSRPAEGVLVSIHESLAEKAKAAAELKLAVEAKLDKKLLGMVCTEDVCCDERDHGYQKAGAHEMVVYYLAGFVHKKITKTITCEECCALLTASPDQFNSEETQLNQRRLTKLRSFKPGCLREVSFRLYALIKEVEEVVHDTLETSAVFGDIFWMVHVTTSKSSGKTTGPSSSAGGSDDETTTLTGAKGTVYRLFKTYGFISVQHPITTSVYFSLRSFENGQHSSLLSSGFQLGDGVVLDAEVGPNECEAKFRASRVARIKGGNAATLSDSSSPASQTPVFAPLVNRTGAIETLKDEFGFIKLEKEQECAFFQAAEIERPLGTAVPALPEVLAVGDKIRFDADLNKNTTARAKWVVTTIHSIQNVPPCHSSSETEGSEIAPGTIIKRDRLIQMVKPEFGFIKFAKPSHKPTEKVKWQATTVWLSEFEPKGDGLNSADESGNEVFLSDDESDIRDLIQERLAADTDDDMDDDILGAVSMLPAASANTIVDGLKQYLRPVSPDSLPLPNDTKSLLDLDKDDSFSPVLQSVEPSIVIFRGATALVTDITDIGGTIGSKTKRVQWVL